MSSFDSSQVIRHLKDKWRGKPCPMCGNGKWSVNDKIFKLREFNEGNLIVGGGPIIPIIPIICESCGNTLLINAIVTKAVVPPKGA